MRYFKRFVQAYNDGTVADDVSWRAYNIEAMADAAGDKRIREGLASVPTVWDRTALTNHMALAQVAADYGLGSPERAGFLLALWRTWFRVACMGVDRQKLIYRKP